MTNTGATVYSEPHAAWSRLEREDARRPPGYRGSRESENTLAIVPHARQRSAAWSNASWVRMRSRYSCTSGVSIPARAAMQSRHNGRSMMSTAIRAARSGTRHLTSGDSTERKRSSQMPRGRAPRRVSANQREGRLRVYAHYGPTVAPGVNSADGVRHKPLLAVHAVPLDGSHTTVALKLLDML